MNLTLEALLPASAYVVPLCGIDLPLFSSCPRFTHALSPNSHTTSSPMLSLPTFPHTTDVIYYLFQYLLKKNYPSTILFSTISGSWNCCGLRNAKGSCSHEVYDLRGREGRKTNKQLQYSVLYVLMGMCRCYGRA